MRRAKRLGSGVGLAVAAGLWLAAAAGADEAGSDEVAVPEPPPAAEAELRPTAVLADPQLEGEPREPGDVAVEDWQARDSFGFGTDMIFPLTRGLGDAGVPPLARWPLYPFTVPFDLGHLAFGTVAGLWGD